MAPDGTLVSISHHTQVAVDAAFAKKRQPRRVEAPLLPREVTVQVAWTATATLAASNKLGAALGHEYGLRNLAEAAAETIRDLLAAKAVSIILIGDRGYRELINVGLLEGEEVRYPPEAWRPISEYPKASAALLAGRGYACSGQFGSEFLREYKRTALASDVGSILGVPIKVADEVRGELFMERGRRVPGFSPGDLAVADMLAGQLAFAIADPAILDC